MSKNLLFMLLCLCFTTQFAWAIGSFQQTKQRFQIGNYKDKLTQTYTSKGYYNIHIGEPQQVTSEENHSLYEQFTAIKGISKSYCFIKVNITAENENNESEPINEWVYYYDSGSEHARLRIVDTPLPSAGSSSSH